MCRGRAGLGVGFHVLGYCQEGELGTVSHSSQSWQQYREILSFCSASSLIIISGIYLFGGFEGHTQ